MTEKSEDQSPESVRPGITREERPWGWFETIVSGENYRVKRLLVRGGHRISLQSHKLRDEHWIVVNGFGAVTVDGCETRVSLGDHVFVPRESHHRVSADEDMVIIEAQMGVCEEEDIVRYSDDYGRS